MADFYEDDEPVENVVKAFNAGEKATTREAEIWIDRGRYGGEPCLYGSRLPVMLLMDYAEHDGDAAVLAAYPQVTADDLDACRAFLSRWVRRDRIHPDPVVLCDPQHSFGSPRVKGVTTNTIADLIWSGASVAEVCADYETCGMTRGDVLVACWFEGFNGVIAHRKWFGPWARRVETALAHAKPDYDAIPDPPSESDVD